MTDGLFFAILFSLMALTLLAGAGLIITNTAEMKKQEEEQEALRTRKLTRLQEVKEAAAKRNAEASAKEYALARTETREPQPYAWMLS